MDMPLQESVKAARMSMDQLAAVRPRLVRLCARLAGDTMAAEDLAQETLIEAWRYEDSLRDPEAYEAWLVGTARNVCRRWLRQRAREGGVRRGEARWRRQGYGESEPVEQAADELDLEVELEREELAELLDRALALLPESTRQVLVERYLRDRAQAEVAARLGLSENVLAVRLHRASCGCASCLAPASRRRR